LRVRHIPVPAGRSRSPVAVTSIGSGSLVVVVFHKHVGCAGKQGSTAHVFDAGSMSCGNDCGSCATSRRPGLNLLLVFFRTGLRARRDRSVEGGTRRKKQFSSVNVFCCPKPPGLRSRGQSLCVSRSRQLGASSSTPIQACEQHLERFRHSFQQQKGLDS